jgi:hypothetical protein
MTPAFAWRRATATFDIPCASPRAGARARPETPHIEGRATIDLRRGLGNVHALPAPHNAMDLPSTSYRPRAPQGSQRPQGPQTCHPTGAPWRSCCCRARTGCAGSAAKWVLTADLTIGAREGCHGRGARGPRTRGHHEAVPADRAAAAEAARAGERDEGHARDEAGVRAACARRRHATLPGRRHLRRHAADRLQLGRPVRGWRRCPRP